MDIDRDVIIAGAGPVGLAAALALAREGAAVTLAGQTAHEASGRTVALFDGSVRLLAELGVWKKLAPCAAPLRRLRIIDDTDNLFRWRPLSFEAAEIGLDAFGWNVEAGALTDALRRVAEAVPGIRLIDALALEPRFAEAGASLLVEGRRLEAALIVAADGQRSRLRQAAGIAARFQRLPQWALTGILRHELPHDDVSTEFHTRGGPCTLVPLPRLERGRAAEGDGSALEQMSSFVWMLQSPEAEELKALDDVAFALAVERRVHSILGKMQVAGRPRGAIPLSCAQVERICGPRLALVGEAAHAFPPIGAQGLNLGLRDVTELVTLVGEALRDGRDIGAPALLDAYDRARRMDIATRTAAVNLMNRSLLSSFLPIDFARGVGMAALDLIGPLRRLVMREGVAPGFGR
ncbi:MAG: FAD-dependent monooxygenase [Hyphomicrobiales bacterium]